VTKGHFFFYWLAHICKRNSSACRNVCVFELIDREDIVFRVYISTSAGKDLIYLIKISSKSFALAGPK